MAISSADLLQIPGVKARDHKKSLSKILTKDFKLKVALGKAHKGWELLCMKGTQCNEPQDAVEEAKNTLSHLIKEGKNSESKKTFVFSRRILGIDTVSHFLGYVHWFVNGLSMCIRTAQQLPNNGYFVNSSSMVRQWFVNSSGCSSIVRQSTI